MLGVAIVSNGRCMELLRHIVRTWLDMRVSVSLVGPELVVRDPHLDILRVTAGAELVLSEADVAPHRHGDAYALAIERCLDPYCLVQADDCLPIGVRWARAVELEPRTLSAIRLLDPLGRRWFDWAVHDETGERPGSYLLPYGVHRPGAYITGAAQIWSPEARDAVSYRGRGFRQLADVRVCWEAQAAGIELRSPRETTAAVIHMDRKPERIHMHPDFEPEPAYSMDL